MEPLRAIYYDTETTGTNVKKDLIVEIAAYDPVNDTSFEELIDPGVPIPPGAAAIHGISDEMVKGKDSFLEVSKRFVEFCTGNVVLIAHNNDSFDRPILESEFERHGQVIPEYKYLDTLKWARRYRPDLPRHSLQHLREVYGFPANNAHRALDDVITLHRVFASMMDDLDIQQAYDLMSTSKLVQIMPFGKYKGKPLQIVPADYVQWLHSSGALTKPENKDLLASFEKYGLINA